MKLSKNVKIMALVTIAVLLVGAFIMLQPVEVEDEFDLYSWVVRVYPSDMTDAPEDWQVDVQAWESIPEEPAQFSTADEDEFIESITLSRYQYNEQWIYNGFGHAYLNHTRMNGWRWMVFLNNGTIDHVNPENNMWNGTMHMNQHMNKNMWEESEGDETDNWTYRFRQTFGAYIVEIELLGY